MISCLYSDKIWELVIQLKVKSRKQCDRCVFLLLWSVSVRCNHECRFDNKYNANCLYFKLEIYQTLYFASQELMSHNTMSRFSTRLHVTRHFDRAFKFCLGIFRPRTISYFMQFVCSSEGASNRPAGGRQNPTFRHRASMKLVIEFGGLHVS